MSELYFRTQILANCVILFPPPASPTLLTLYEGDNNRSLIFITDSKTGRLLLEGGGGRNDLFGLQSLLSHTGLMLKNHIAALRNGELPTLGEQTPAATEDDTNATQRLEAEIARLRSENDELRQRLDRSTASHAEALQMVQTSYGHQMGALVMAQRCLEQQLGGTDNPPT